MLRKFTVALAISLSVVSLASAQVIPAIEATVGTGSKTAHLTLDFGTDFYTFAYKYDGTNVTAGDMISAIDTALVSFSVDMPGDRNSGYGRFINGLGYGSNSLASFTSNFNTPPYYGWNYYISTSSLVNPTPSWSGSQLGIDGRDGSNPAGSLQSLDTHSWHGFSWGQYDTNTFDFLGSAPRVQTTVATAPEPGTLALVACSVIGLVALRRRNR